MHEQSSCKKKEKKLQGVYYAAVTELSAVHILLHSNMQYVLKDTSFVLIFVPLYFPYFDKAYLWNTLLALSAKVLDDATFKLRK